MKQRTTDTMVSAALRDLDAAPETTLTGPERERADATFARIVATPSGGQVPVEPDGRRRRWSRLVVPVGLVGAAGVAVPILLLGGGSAYGSWTPTPEPLTDRTAAAAATTCHGVLDMPDRGERVVLAERRGEWTYVLFSGAEAEGACLMPNELVGQDPAEHEGEFFASGGAGVDDAPHPARDRIEETMTLAGNTDEGLFRWNEGFVGSDVTAVTVHTPTGLQVQASVAGGRFAAWWPAGDNSGTNPELTDAATYTVTLADGSTRRATG